MPYKAVKSKSIDVFENNCFSCRISVCFEQSYVLLNLRRKAFENSMGKGENARYQRVSKQHKLMTKGENACYEDFLPLPPPFFFFFFFNKNEILILCRILCFQFGHVQNVIVSEHSGFEWPVRTLLFSA